MNEKVAIVIGSCDAYLDIVKLYIEFLRKYWSNCRYPIYVATEEKTINDTSVITVNNTIGTEWCERVRNAVEMTDCKYIWLTVDDLFLCEEVDDKRISEIVRIMDKDGIEYYGFPPKKLNKSIFRKKIRGRVKYKDSDYMMSISKRIPYGINMGTAIWERKALLRVFDEGLLTAWDVENYFLKKAYNNPRGFYEHYIDDNGTSLSYAHMIKKGMWIPKGVKDIATSGITIDYTQRGFVPWSSRLRSFVVGSGSYVIPLKLRFWIKKWLSKVGFRFATKY